MIKENLEKLFEYIEKGNAFGEKITLVGATKTRDAETINQAIALGLDNIGENKAQEFRDKFPLVLPCNYHFFGRLQKNKVKYLIGKACLIQSVDSFDLAQEISCESQKKNVVTKILIEINLGEEQKGGVALERLDETLLQIEQLPNVVVKGLMTVLPHSSNIDYLKGLCLLIRKKYDILKLSHKSFDTLSMGMSADYEIAIDCGSNMIRVGSAIFGARDYSKLDKEEK